MMMDNPNAKLFYCSSSSLFGDGYFALCESLISYYLFCLFVACKNEKLDIAFVIDGSGSICNNEAPGCMNWRYILRFLDDCVAYLNIGPNNDRYVFSS